MEFRIDPSSRMPIYRQLTNSPRGHRPGTSSAQERLPSVRDLPRLWSSTPTPGPSLYGTGTGRDPNTRPGLGVFVAQPKAELSKKVRRSGSRPARSFPHEAVHRPRRRRSGGLVQEQGQVPMAKRRSSTAIRGDVPAMPDMIVTHRLTKYYDRRRVVDTLDLRVPRGGSTDSWDKTAPANQPSSKCSCGRCTPITAGRRCSAKTPEVAVPNAVTDRLPGRRPSPVSVDDRR